MSRAVLPLVTSFLLIWGCSSKDQKNISRQYAADATVVVAPTVTGECSAPQPAGASEQSFVVSGPDDAGQYAVLEELSGCTIPAHLEPHGNILSAQGVDCVFGADSQLAKIGVTRRTYSQVRLDLELGTWSAKHQTNYAGGKPSSYSACVVTEGRLTEVAGPSQSRFRYEGTIVRFDEVPLGSPACIRRQPVLPTSGYVTTQVRDPGTAMLLKLEGIGCTVTASSSDKVLFSGDGQPCQLDPQISIQEFGFTEQTFDTLQFDTSSRHLMAKGTQTRRAADGSAFVSCFETDITLTQMPAPR